VGGVYYRKCGEPWDFYYVSHEMTPQERSDFVKGICCPKCRVRIPEISEKEKVLSSLIETPNEVEREVTQLTEALMSRRPCITTVSDADAIIDTFFLSCQIEEERIKTARKKDYISVVQVQALDNELRGWVKKMYEIIQTSPLLMEAGNKLFESEPSHKALFSTE
jgi:hypothetical protein